MATITYLIADTLPAEAGRLALTQLLHLTERGHDVALFFLRRFSSAPPPGLPFPVYDFEHADSGRLLRLLGTRDGVKVATDWSTAQLLSQLDDDARLYLTADFETKSARSYAEARGIIHTYGMGLPIASTSRWAAEQIERLYGVDVAFIPPVVDGRIWYPRAVPRSVDRVAREHTGSGDESRGPLVAAEALELANGSHALEVVTFGDRGVRYGGIAHRHMEIGSDDELAELLSSSAFLLSSSYHDSVAYVQLTAMACGCPVVASRADGNDFCVDDVNSLLVDPGDAGALAAAMLRVLEDSDLRDRLGAAAIETASRYAADVAMPELERALREAMASRRSSAVTETHSGRLEGGVSVVIPTRNGAETLPAVLRRIDRVRDSADIEVIVVDSGSTDDTLQAAGEAGATIVQIPPEEFNHGATRNLGAERASREFLLFLTQDALPSGDDWLLRMAGPLLSDDGIAAATVREIPRSDADLFACWGIWNHQNALDWHADKVVSSEGAEDDIRTRAQLTTNCLLVRRSVFEEFRFNSLALGEDLDLGLRLLRAGHKLAFLKSVGVIHSHSREPAYVLRRHYADAKWVPRILGSPPDMSSLAPEACLRAARGLSARVAGALARPGDPFSAVLGGLQEPNGTLGCDDGSEDKSLQDILAALPQVAEGDGRDAGLLVPSFLGMARGLVGYVAHTGLALEDCDSEITDALHKMTAACIGGFLGSRVSAEDEPSGQSLLAAIDDVLGRGV